ncbi:hypothetical protein WOLCODRAFT_20501 [Wolfiporia cocos MD-104 SS10]|uniref:F-box domain-containing protein n=1 Tax=Wolfiporia cocos (strain MD-104) TaxID=742152 RepID=A0A2H3J2H3_WOLCO|nr:hypothetical protein WOLCODRAFT_20501 [Wolfiporia cocos MD-104 SS10]
MSAIISTKLMTVKRSHTFSSHAGYRSAISTTGLHSLPPELVDNIIDYLWDDKQSLIQCSLVHWKLRPRTIAHLFRRLYIRDVHDFCSFIECATEDTVARLVRSVREVIISDYVLMESSNIYQERICCALSIFSRIHVLELRHWHSVDVPSCVIACLVASLPSVTNLRVGNVCLSSKRELLRLLCSFPMLSELAIRDRGGPQIGIHGFRRVSATSVPSPSEYFPQERADRHHAVIRLERLHMENVHYWADVATWLLAPQFDLHLRSLCLRWKYGGENFNFAGFFQKIGPRLEELDVGFDGVTEAYHDQLITGIQAICVPHLQRLKIAACLCSNLYPKSSRSSPRPSSSHSHHQATWPYSWIPNLISSVCHSANKLQEITMSVHIPGVEDLSQIPWIDVDHALKAAADRYTGMCLNFDLTSPSRIYGLLEVTREIFSRLKLSQRCYVPQNDDVFTSICESLYLVSRSLTRTDTQNSANVF